MGAPSDSADYEDDDNAVLLSAAGADPSDEVNAPLAEVPCCPACGRPTDDVSKMTDAMVLDELKSEFYRDLLRSMRSGQATHQEKAIARGILRDNHVVAEEDEEKKAKKGGRRRGARLADETYSFSPRTLDETEGG